MISTHQALGSGFAIASYDLDFRGAGDLLGGEQSGHLATVGVEMYTQMLSEAIARARGEVLSERVECDIKVQTSYGLPQDYVSAEPERLRLYKQLFLLKTHDDVADFAESIEDRFGKMPLVAQALFDVAMLKITLQKLAVKRLVQLSSEADKADKVGAGVGAGVGADVNSKERYELYIPKLPDHQVDHILAQVSQHQDVYALVGPHQLHVTVVKAASESPSSLQKLHKYVQRLVKERSGGE